MGKLRVALGLVLAAAATTFAVGVSVERHQGHHDEAASPAAAAVSTAPEGSAEREAAERKQTAPSAQPAVASPTESGEGTEKLFGINTESWWLVGFAVALSVLLAGAAVTIRSPLLVMLIAFVAIGATVFDVREVVHQIDESRSGVATLAGVTAFLHLAVLAIAGTILLAKSRPASAPNV